MLIYIISLLLFIYLFYIFIFYFFIFFFYALSCALDSFICLYISIYN